MGINLLDVIKNQLSDTLMSKAASYLGEDHATTQTAMNAIMPAVLGGMANQAATPNGAASLLNSLQTSNYDGSIFGSLGTLLGGGSATQGLLSSGGGIVNSLFGDKISGIVNFIAQLTGIKSGSATSLMSIAAPILMSAIGRHLGNSSATAGGLTSLLGSQLPFIKNALPAGMGNALGLSNLDLTPSVSKAAPTLTEEKSLVSRLFPWLLLLAAGLAAFYYMKSCQQEAVPAATPVVETPKAVVDEVKKLKLPDGEIVVKSGSFLDQLYSEIIDTKLDPTRALTFDNVNFATNSATLTDSSKTQLDDLAHIMRAFPKVEIKIDGHTDNVGNAADNLKLSEARAASVKAYLATHGIDIKRVSTAGFGSTKPVADNATADGKAKNRRIEAFLMKK